MTDKLDKFLDNDKTIPAPSENAKKMALNMAAMEYETYNFEKNEKKSQGFLNLRRLTGMNNQKDRRSKMKRSKFIYGGMATAMVVVLAGGTALYQTRTHELVTNDSGRQILGYVNEAEESDAKQVIQLQGLKTSRNVTDGSPPPKEAKKSNDTAAKETMAKGESFIPMPTGPATNTGVVVPSETNEIAQLAAPSSQMSKQRSIHKNLASDSIGIMPQPYPIPEPMPTEVQENDKFEDHEISAVKQVSSEPVSTFSIDVDTASYAYVRRQLNQGRMPSADAVRIEEMINYFPYDYTGPAAGKDTAPFKANIAVVDAPWKEGNKLIHIGLKGYDIDTDVRPRANLVFLLDVSGSMSQPDKLPLLKSSFKMLLNQMHPDDTVGIVVYAGSAGTVLQPTKVQNKQTILNALESLRAGGGTAGAAGIEGAYALAEQNFDKEAVNRIILATDGDFNVGVHSNEDLKELIEEKRDSGIFLSVLGFGTGNLNDHLMQTLAQNGNGIAAHIDTLSEARKVLVDEATSSLFPIAKDVKVQIEFNPEIVSEYRLIGYETRTLAREDFNNDKIDAGDIGSGHTVTAIYEITPKGSGNELYDQNRYAKVEDTGARTDFGNEYAFLKLRYKEPNGDTSKLITTPITTEDEVTPNSDIYHSIAVAGFGQTLKNDKHVGNLTYDEILNLAQKGKGEDTYGYRAEFINLVRLAQSLDSK